MKKIGVFILFMMCCFLFVGCNNADNIKDKINIYTLNLEYNDQNKEVFGDMSLSYINQTKDNLNEVKFHLYPNAFRENSKAKVVSLANSKKAYYNGKSYGNIDINSVMIEDKVKDVVIEGEDENILNVKLDKSLSPNKRVLIKIKFKTKLANIKHRLGYGEDCVNICNFYPVACVYENGNFMTKLYHYNGDPFYSKIASYKVNFTYDDMFTLATSGTKTETKKDNKTTATINAECVRDFAMVLSKKFKTKQNIVDDIKLTYYYVNDKEPDKSLATATKAVKMFNKKFGKYPYKELNVVETSFVHGGMEYPNIVLISDDITDRGSYDMVIVHELAHQWWYGVVGNNQYSYGWIDEGLTEYSTALFYDEYKEYNLSKNQIVHNATNAYSNFMRVYKDVTGSVDTTMNRDLDKFKTEPEYIYNTYTKGLLMFATIHELLGDKTFYSCLRYYFTSCAYKEVLPKDVIYCFSKASKRNLENLFDSWINGKVVIVSPD